MELITGENDKGRRLDRILRKALADHPLPLIHRLLRQGKVLVNGKPAKAQDRLDCGAKISIVSLNSVPQKEIIQKQKFPDSSIDIIWEDCGLIAVNKPKGLAVHGPDSLELKVRSYLADKLPASLSFKPGPLHRLDKPSSGVVMFSASLEGARLFSTLIRERNVHKTYLAVVEGIVKNEEIWQDNLVRDKEKKKTYVSNPAGKHAITKIKPLAIKHNTSLIMAEIITGRTHQIRAQAAFHGYPLVGDIKYGGTVKKEQIIVRQPFPDNAKYMACFFLHSWKMKFLQYSIEAPVPQEFLKSFHFDWNKIKLY
jgi:23S rRNA pseudouridine955/2504/2580 synthase